MDDTAFDSTYEDWEGRSSSGHRVEVSGNGALFKGSRRLFNELATTAEQFI